MAGCGTSGAVRVLTLVSLLSIAFGCSGSAREAPSASRAHPAAGGGFVPDTKPAPTARWEDSLVPAGTTIPLVLLGRLDSASSRTGDMFQARVTHAVLVGDFVAIPSDSVVHGLISAVVPAKEGQEEGGRLTVSFRSVSTPTGAGAEIRATLSGIGKGGAGKNAAVLAGAGAGRTAGSVITAGARGRDVILEENTAVSITLDQPISIKVRR